MANDLISERGEGEGGRSREINIPDTRKDMVESFCLISRTLRRKEDCADDVSNATWRLRRRSDGSADRNQLTMSRHHHR